MSLPCSNTVMTKSRIVMTSLWQHCHDKIWNFMTSYWQHCNDKIWEGFFFFFFSIFFLFLFLNLTKSSHVVLVYCRSPPLEYHIAYFLVHSFATSLYFDFSVLYMRAMSGTSGSSGLGSQSNEQIDNRTGR